MRVTSKGGLSSRCNTGPAGDSSSRSTNIIVLRCQFSTTVNRPSFSSIIQMTAQIFRQELSFIYDDMRDLCCGLPKLGVP
jgi:hypothetical protein